MSGKHLSDAEVAEFTSRLRAVFSERKGRALAKAAGVSYSSLAHTVDGTYRPGSTVVSKVNAVLSSQMWRYNATSVDALARAAISADSECKRLRLALDAECKRLRLALDAECKRLRLALDAAEARVRAAVVAMLGGAS